MVQTLLYQLSSPICPDTFLCVCVCNRDMDAEYYTLTPTYGSFSAANTCHGNIDNLTPTGMHSGGK